MRNLRIKLFLKCSLSFLNIYRRYWKKYMFFAKLELNKLFLLSAFAITGVASIFKSIFSYIKFNMCFILVSREIEDCEWNKQTKFGDDDHSLRWSWGEWRSIWPSSSSPDLYRFSPNKDRRCLEERIYNYLWRGWQHVQNRKWGDEASIHLPDE